MAKSRPSDGQNLKDFNDFLNNFDSFNEEQICQAINYFEQPKDNGHMRMDDLNLPALCSAIVKFYDHPAFENAPPSLKHHAFIKLQQGRSSWIKGVPGIATSKKKTEEKSKFPWEKPVAV